MLSYCLVLSFCCLSFFLYSPIVWFFLSVVCHSFYTLLLSGPFCCLPFFLCSSIVWSFFFSSILSMLFYCLVLSFCLPFFLCSSIVWSFLSVVCHSFYNLLLSGPFFLLSAILSMLFYCLVLSFCLPFFLCSSIV